jgi:hypothetical protein
MWRKSFFVAKFVLFVAAAHVLRIHDLEVVLAAENTESYV